MIKFCKNCEVETDRYVSGKCKPCVKARGAVYLAMYPEKAKASVDAYRAANKRKTKSRRAAYYKANAEKEKAAALAYQAANPEKTKANVAAYRAANIERLKAAEAIYCAANAHKIKARHALYRAKNIEKLRAQSSAWASKNPEARRISQQNRRARQLANGGSLSKGLSAKLFKLQRGKCACCSKPLGINFQLDHIHPIARGGANIDSNIQLLRRLCNSQKRAKHPIDFMQERGFLL